MKEAKSNPFNNATYIKDIKDPRWDGWQKYAVNVNGVEIHFVYDPINKLFDDFKFK